VTPYQTFRRFVKGLFGRKGIDKNLWVKKFIKNIKYSKEQIAVSFYFKIDCEKEAGDIFGSGRPHPTATENVSVSQGKKIPCISRDTGNHKEWLPKGDSFQTINIIIPNTIHGCKSKDLSR